MNKVILIGRLTKDPEMRYSGEQSIAVARYVLAIDRKYKTGQQTADFIQCVAFGKAAEFAERYFRKGTRIAITGRLQTGSYTNQEGYKVYTTDIVVEEQEFAESKAAGEQQEERKEQSKYKQQNEDQGRQTRPFSEPEKFMEMCDDMELPFN